MTLTAHREHLSFHEALHIVCKENCIDYTEAYCKATAIALLLSFESSIELTFVSELKELFSHGK